MAELVDPDVRWRAAFLRMAEEFRAAGEARYGEAHGMDEAAFAAWVEVLRKHARGEGLARGKVAERTFWMADGDAVVGVSRLRPKLDAFHERLAGHIGFDVAPSRRNAETVARLFALTLERARAAGVERVIVCFDAGNESRQRAVEAAGGVLLDEVSGMLPEGDAYRKRRYVLVG